MSDESDSTKIPPKEESEKVDSEKSADLSQNVKEKLAENNVDKKEVETKSEDEKDDVSEDSEVKKPLDVKLNDAKVENSVKAKENDKHETEEEEEEEEEGEEEEEEEEEISEEEEEKVKKDVKENNKSENKSKSKDKNVPLLDQPLELSGKRERKNVQRFTEGKGKSKSGESSPKVDPPKGGGDGTALGDIPRIDASISRFKNDDLKNLHNLLFKSPGKTLQIKKNIRRFKGFDFAKDSDEYHERVETVLKLDTKHIKSICEMLDLPKDGDDEANVDKIMEFLSEPRDSGKAVSSGGRPKRASAVRANNRGYSSHDDYSSDDLPAKKRTTRAKGQRANLKDDSSSESDEEFKPESDDEEERPRVRPKPRPQRKKAPKSDDDDEGSEMEINSSEDSDAEPKGRKKKVVKTNNKSKSRTAVKRGRGRPAPKKTPGGKKKKSKDTSDEDASDQKDDSSSEDEPLSKKAKNLQPPTDEEIKTYVKEILEGANLEEITMKTVCQQVYSHYPEFDLAHKKDFIKSTVKSLIST